MNRILIKISNKYIVTLGILSAWILCYNQQNFVGVTLLSVIIVILYALSLITKENGKVNNQKIVTEDAESLEWLNTLLQRWWLFSISGTENYFCNKINQVLQVNTPEFFEFIKVDKIKFGNSSPYASSIRFNDLSMPNGVPAYLTEKSLFRLIKFVKETRFYSFALELDVSFHLTGTEVYLLCKHKKFHDESRIVLKDFFINGLVNMKITLDTAVVFPHISRISMYFSEKQSPKFDYNISLSNVSNLMDRFKFWITFIIHSNILKQKIKISNLGLMKKMSTFLSDQQCLFGKSANGALLVKIVEINHTTGFKYSFKQINLCTVSMGNQINEFRRNFHANGSFSIVLLVQNILEEEIIIKLKSENPIGIQTLGSFNIRLKDYPLEIHDNVPVKKTENHIELKLKLEYFKLNSIENEKEIEFNEAFDSGILHVDIIAAQNLLNNIHNNAVDSYCVLFANQHKIVSSQVIKETRYPKWNTSVEFLIDNLSKVTLMFVVYNERKLNEDGLHEIIGICVCSFNEVRKNLINYSEPLFQFGANNDSEKIVGKIMFNVIFRPVEAVKYAHNVIITKHDEIDNSTDNNSANDLNESEKPLLKLEVKSAKNLTKKDLIGSSDPYFKVKRNGIEIYKSKYIKNSLMPQWNEKVNVSDFDFQDILKIEIYDKDIIKRDDFMGQLILDAKILHDLSMENESRWFHLENASDGDIQIEAKFGKQDDDLCTALRCKDQNNGINSGVKSNDENSDSETYQSSVHSNESQLKKRIFGEVNSVVLGDVKSDIVDEYILKAGIKKLKLSSKCTHIIKAYSTSQVQKTVYFSNYAFAVLYSPSKENLKLKFTLIQKKTKKKVDELVIDIKRFADFMKTSECQLRMLKGSVINIFCKEKGD